MNPTLIVLVASVAVVLCDSRVFIPVLSRSEVRDDAGQFSLSYKSADGTVVSEQGVLTRNHDNTDNVLVKKGSYSFQTPEGTPISLTYVADEHGFRPVGNHLPKPVEPVHPTF